MRLAAAFLILLLSMPPAFAEAQTIVIGYLGEARSPPLPLGPLDAFPADDGLQGARLGVADDDGTGRFVGQHFGWWRGC
ncbi:hypothetical protein [Mesorhizobium sp. B2-1-3A]|uniref:hypothetical protein n=1 Tax=Mesorhizobium sp. B2-1-3A TaxID=2589971 RepID=UPI001FEE7333|nr:hypothetical protein [Mesorhizobium sp. B2-1-3A]